VGAATVVDGTSVSCLLLSSSNGGLGGGSKGATRQVSNLAPGFQNSETNRKQCKDTPVAVNPRLT